MEKKINASSLRFFFFLGFLFFCRQDALSTATNTIRGTREIDGETYFDIQLDSPDVQYLCSVTVKMGKVFALFVKCPTKSFKQDEEAFRHVVETFRTI